MVGKASLMIGQTKSYLTVIGHELRMEAGKNRTFLICKCVCGNDRFITMSKFNSLDKFSCGCMAIRSNGKLSDGRKKLSEYRAYRDMLYRCNNPNSKSYPRYGARGITVCSRWLDSYENFIEDMGLKTSPDLSLDRIDVNGNYEPSNCRWANATVQANNRRPKVKGYKHKPRVK